MSLLSDVASYADTATDILGDNTGPSGPSSDTPCKYYHGDWIGVVPDGAGRSTAPFDLGVRDLGKYIELIHFGFVHGDYSSYFDHKPASQDTVDLALPSSAPQKRAIMYRAALERETLLLSGFVASTQTVLKDREDSESGSTDPLSSPEAGFGALAGVVDDMIGGGGDNSASAVKSTSFNAINDKVKGVGATLNTTTVAYKDTHQAGKDLHQARANYRALLYQVRNPPPPKKGLLSEISAVAGALPIAGDIFNFIQGIATRVFDIYVCIYAELALNSELAIEKGCHDLSLDAITNNKSPIFPLWFVRADGTLGPGGGPGWTPPKQDLLSVGSGQDNDVGKQLGEVPDKLKNTAQDAAVQQLSDFLDVPVDNYPAQPFLDQALLPEPAREPAKPPQSVGDIAAQTFSKVLALPVPPFAEDIISTIMQMIAEMLDSIYQKLLGWDASQPIDRNAVYEAARRRLLEKLIDLIVSKLSFLKDLEKGASGTSILASSDYDKDSNKGKDVTTGDAVKKGEAMGMDELTERLAPVIDPVLEFAFKDLADRLEAFRSKAAAEKAINMEVYLGRLPYLRALLFRNTFFPFWDALVQEVFGNIGGPIASLMNSSKGFFKGAKDAAHDVSKYAHKAKAVDDYYNSQDGALKASTDPNQTNIDKYKDAWDNADAPPDPDQTEPTLAQDFPISARKDSAEGKKIDLGEWKGVKLIEDSALSDFPPDASAAPPPPAPPPSSSPLDSAMSAVSSLF